MEISFDPAKRVATLIERGLDFADAAEVFAGPSVTIEDIRHSTAKPAGSRWGFSANGSWCWSGRHAAQIAASFP